VETHFASKIWFFTIMTADLVDSWSVKFVTVSRGSCVWNLKKSPLVTYLMLGTEDIFEILATHQCISIMVWRVRRSCSGLLPRGIAVQHPRVELDQSWSKACIVDEFRLVHRRGKRQLRTVRLQFSKGPRREAPVVPSSWVKTFNEIK